MIEITYIGANAIVVGVFLYVFVSVCRQGKLMASIATPVAMLSIVAMMYTIGEIKARPIYGMPSVEFEYHYHITDGETIELWASSDEREFPQTWIFPYSDEKAKALEEMKKKGEEGIRQKAKAGNNKGNDVFIILGSPFSNNRSNNALKHYEKKKP